MHEVRRLIPKMREIFTNSLRNVSAPVIARVKRCIVKLKSTLSCNALFFFLIKLTIAHGLKLAKLP